MDELSLAPFVLENVRAHLLKFIFLAVIHAHATPPTAAFFNNCSIALTPQFKSLKARTGFVWLYHAVPHENLVSVARFGFYSAVGNSTLAEGFFVLNNVMDSRVDRPGVVLAFRVPRHLVQRSPPAVGYGFSLSAQSQTNEIPYVQIWAHGTHKNLREHVQRKGGPVGRLDPHLIDWRESWRATALAYYQYANSPKPKRAKPKMGFPDHLSWLEALDLSAKMLSEESS